MLGGYLSDVLGGVGVGVNNRSSLFEKHFKIREPLAPDITNCETAGSGYLRRGPTNGYIHMPLVFFQNFDTHGYISGSVL